MDEPIEHETFVPANTGWSDQSVPDKERNALHCGQMLNVQII